MVLAMGGGAIASSGSESGRRSRITALFMLIDYAQAARSLIFQGFPCQPRILYS